MLFLGERRRSQMADDCENLFVEVNPKQPYSKTGSSVDENLLVVNINCCIYEDEKDLIDFLIHRAYAFF